MDHSASRPVGRATTPREGTASHDEQERIRRRLRRLAHLWDSHFRLPGTDFRFGLDGLLGLIPGVGDLAGAAFSCYLIYEAEKLGASRRQQAQMVANVLLDALIGTVPLVGDLFDFAFKANQRNLKILGIDPKS
ncbi:MAG: DUF4112 domain-containing protein [Sumerlaeia bacterium]